MSELATIVDNAVVEFHYKLTDKSGTTLDTSEGREPLAYIQGKQNIVSGLEKQMNGKNVGEKFVANVPAAEAYGPYYDGMVQAVDKDQFDGIDNLQLGMQFQVETEQGAMVVMVKEIQEDKIVLDGNHPLAGIDLTFDVEVVSVRQATEEELAHGHLHMGAGCCGGGNCNDSKGEAGCCDDDRDGGCCH
jgi:FKBP-type peptidyl-prolyl cis-trans isomerase SlyD